MDEGWESKCSVLSFEVHDTPLTCHVLFDQKRDVPKFGTYSAYNRIILLSSLKTIVPYPLIDSFVVSSPNVTFLCPSGKKVMDVKRKLSLDIW
mmetsp:Transcript_5832/g.8458  ORF Transcript_5832/g.8458 Transcript_5832/m.8458 type:complete len:93 (+) Transcript_5832:70-348(+)